jgi:SAM-dependent methyltransferase
MIDQDRITEASRLALAADLRILQGFRLGQTDREHIEKLLGYMRPGDGTTWLDVGCGFGEPARLMKELRPYVEFYLITNNQFQLENVPEGLDARFADMHNIPFRDASFDGVMYLYSLCHADTMERTLTETARLTRPGGKLFVFDYIRLFGNDVLSLEHLASRFLHLGEIKQACKVAGWEFIDYDMPAGSDALFRSVFEDQGLYDRIFGELAPAIWWAYRK